MRCYQCGSQIKDDAKFCPKCGISQQITAEMIDAAKRNVQWATTQLYNMTYNNVYYEIHAMIKDEDTIQDILQDSFLKAFNKLDQLEEPEKFKAWIKRIAHNQTVDYLRKKKTFSLSDMSPLDLDEDFEIEDLNPNNLPEVAVDQKETMRIVNDMLSNLSEDQRAVMGMYCFDNMTTREIAEALGISENTVKSRIYSARKKMDAQKKELEKKGVKLFTLTPLVLLAALLRKEEAFAAETPNAQVLGAIQNGLTQAGAGSAVSSSSAATGAESASTATTSAQTGTSVGVKAGAEVAKAGVATAGKAVATKAIIGVVVAAVAVGGIAGGVTVHRNNQNNQVSDGVAHIETSQNVTPNIPKTDGTDANVREIPKTETGEMSIDEAYQAILDEYAEAIAVDDNDYIENMEDYIEQFPNAASVGMQYYHGGEVKGFDYSYYDIDGNGQNELIVAQITSSGTIRPIDIYTYDGNAAVKIFDDYNLGGPKSDAISIYENGAILWNNPAHSDTRTQEYYKISDNGYSAELIATAVNNEDDTQTVYTVGNNEVDEQTFEQECTDGTSVIEDFGWTAVGEEPEETDSLTIDEAYQAILDEYAQAMAVDNNDYFNNIDSYEEQFSDINPSLMYAYHYDDMDGIYYTYYDIDGNGQNELIIADIYYDYMCYANIYTYNGEKAVEAFDFDDYSLGMDDSINFDKDGNIIVECGDAFLGLYRIDDDGYTMRLDAYVGFNDNGEEVSYYREGVSYDGELFDVDAQMYDYDNETVGIDEGTLDWTPIGQAVSYSQSSSDYTIDDFIGDYEHIDTNNDNAEYLLSININDGKLKVSEGSDLHGGWMVFNYESYEINGNKLTGYNSDWDTTDTYVLDGDTVTKEEATVGYDWPYERTD